MNTKEKEALLIERTVENGLSLLRDARFLHHAERYQGAAILAVLAFEEVGKTLLLLWEVPKPPKSKLTFHTRKQLAAASLLMASGTLKVMDEAVDEAIKAREVGDVTRHLIKLMENPDMQIAYIALGGLLDTLKNAAAYIDESNGDLSADPRPVLKPQGIALLFESTRRAIELIQDFRTFESGMQLFISNEQNPDMGWMSRPRK